MDKVANRKDGTLTIKKIKPNEAQIRTDLYYLLENMNRLDDLIQKGKEAEKEFKKYEREFTRLCKTYLEGEQDE